MLRGDSESRRADIRTDGLLITVLLVQTPISTLTSTKTVFLFLETVAVGDVHVTGAECGRLRGPMHVSYRGRNPVTIINPRVTQGGLRQLTEFSAGMISMLSVYLPDVP